MTFKYQGSKLPYMVSVYSYKYKYQCIYYYEDNYVMIDAISENHDIFENVYNLYIIYILCMFTDPSYVQAVPKKVGTHL